MKTLIGTVVSNKMTKTVVVEVERLWQHPVYKKRVKRTSRFFAHTEQTIDEGTTVKLGECKPISKKKQWNVLEILKSK